MTATATILAAKKHSEQDVGAVLDSVEAEPQHGARTAEVIGGWSPESGRNLHRGRDEDANAVEVEARLRRELRELVAVALPVHYHAVFGSPSGELRPVAASWYQRPPV